LVETLFILEIVIFGMFLDNEGLELCHNNDEEMLSITSDFELVTKVKELKLKAKHV
jgi:hypothetical protein